MPANGDVHVLRACRCTVQFHRGHDGAHMSMSRKGTPADNAVIGAELLLAGASRTNLPARIMVGQEKSTVRGKGR